MIRLIPALATLAFSSAALADDAAVSGHNRNSALNGPSHVVVTDGEGIYRSLCQECHMPNGQGGSQGAAGYPALAKNPKLEAAGYPVTMVLFGHKAMPGFAGAMSDQQIVAVVSFVQSHFGNAFKDAPTVEDVKMARDAGK